MPNLTPAARSSLPAPDRRLASARRSFNRTLAGGLAGAWCVGIGPRPAQASTAARDRADPVVVLLRDHLTSQGSSLLAVDVRGAQVHHVAASRPDAPAVDESTLFEIGSITKTFTALLLADAVVRGACRLDDPVEAVLPAGLLLRDRAGQPLRWRDLATHRSGLPRLAANMAPANPADPYADYRWEDLARFLENWQPTRTRDELFEYSNVGFGLLGKALALQAGLDYAELLRRRVIEPLAMQEVRVAMVGRPSLASGHDARGRSVPPWHFTDATAGAGAIVANGRSLARYAQAALGLVKHPLREAFALCLRRHGDGATPMNPMGLAWMLAPLNGRTVFNHDGATFGFSSSLWLDPKRGRASIVLADAAVPVNRLALHLLDDSVPAPDPRAQQAHEKQRAVPAAPSELALLAGVYALSPQFKVTVRAADDRLFAQASGQGEFELYRLAGAGPRRFFARVTVLEIEFDGRDDMPPGFTLHQGGQQLRFVRE